MKKRMSVSYYKEIRGIREMRGMKGIRGREGGKK
jgi:hypothetical protein